MDLYVKQIYHRETLPRHNCRVGGCTNAGKTEKKTQTRNCKREPRRYATTETAASANDKCQRLLGVGQERLR